MSKVDDELTLRLRRAERPVDGDAVFEELSRRRSHRERARKVQAGVLAFAVLAATAGGFVFLGEAFDTDRRDVGDEQAPSPVANGEIVFSAKGNDGYTHLYAVQPDGSSRRQITDFGTNDTDPSVSPDGRTIAFVHQLEDVNPTIASIPIRGGIVTRLIDPEFEGSSPTWSPDGTEVLIVGGRTGLYSISSNGSDRRTVVSFTKSPVADPSWSPDGSLIVFAGQDGSLPPARRDWRLTIVPRDGKSIADLPGSNEDARSPAWSPDGSLIAFLAPHAGGTGIWTIPAPFGGKPSLIATTSRLENDLTWAPDGSSLLASDGEWIYRVDATPSGDPRGNLVQLVKGRSPAWQPVPAGSEPVQSPTSEPTVSASSEPAGRDIGLGFPVCHVERLSNIDWYGDGTLGAAWTGTRTTDDGRCSSDANVEYIVAADLDGDGIAEAGGMGFLKTCLLCRPFAATDLNGDGVLELVVLEEASSTPSYSIYEVSVPTSERSPGIYALSVAPPGHPEANLPADAPIRFIVGGDEGFSGGLRCENYPKAPVIVYTWFLGEVDADTDLQGHETRVALRDEGIFHVLDTRDFTIGRDEPTNISTAPACGVDFHPAA